MDLGTQANHHLDQLSNSKYDHRWWQTGNSEAEDIAFTMDSHDGSDCESDVDEVENHYEEVS